MTITPPILQQIITLLERRLGLSATTLSRIGLESLLDQITEGNIPALLDELQATDEHHPTWQRVIHALTIGETYFLRDKEHFRILREHMLPRLILERRQQNDLTLSIWCVGCSTGEEAYSIAITLYEVLHDIDNWEINIVASDINQRAIESARAGRYRDWSFRQTPDTFQKQYFTPIDDEWQITPKIQTLVKFVRLNAMNGVAIYNADIIFARHMLMYLNQESILQVEALLHQALKPEGWLVLGQAEALRSDRSQWRLHLFPGTPIYQKASPLERLTDPISYPSRQMIEATNVTHDVDDETGHYQLAVEAIHADAPDRAEQHLSSVLSDHPDHTETHILLASILANRQLYPEALSHVEFAIGNGLFADAHYIKALILLEQDQEDNAIQSLNAAIYCDRQHALAGMMLGNIYQRRQDIVRATRSWRNALKAVEGKPEDTFVSDVSDLTVARLRGIIQKQQSLLDLTQNPST